MKSVPNIRCKKARRRPEPKLFEIGGNGYCRNYSPVNITCVNCVENQEGPWRGNCFERPLKPENKPTVEDKK